MEGVSNLCKLIREGLVRDTLVYSIVRSTMNYNESQAMAIAYRHMARQLFSARLRLADHIGK